MPFRSSCWQHVDGREATIKALTGVLAEHKEALDLGDNIYSTDNMQSDADVPALLTHQQMLLQLFELDTRGGIFSQGVDAWSSESGQPRIGKRR